MLVVSFVGGLPPRWLRLHNILCHKKVNVISWMVDTVLRDMAITNNGSNDNNKNVENSNNVPSLAKIGRMQSRAAR
ncbi:hypothetical protein KSS87_013162, partial [Heliosperma pusillum]